MQNCGFLKNIGILYQQDNFLLVFLSGIYKISEIISVKYISILSQDPIAFIYVIWSELDYRLRHQLFNKLILLG